MGISERSRKRVEERLASLERRHGSFPVDEASIPLPSGEYRRERDHFGDDADALSTAFAKVRHDDGRLLYVHGDGAVEYTYPRVQGVAEEPVEARLREAVERTGVECRIVGVDGATVFGYHDADDEDAEPVYRLNVEFDAEHVGGEPTAARWLPEGVR